MEDRNGHETASVIAARSDVGAEPVSGVAKAAEGRRPDSASALGNRHPAGESARGRPPGRGACLDYYSLQRRAKAIVDATHFDVRQIDRTFTYDHAAYGEVNRNLGRLIGSGQLRQAMTLAQELMKRGSYQVEMSDEGLITGTIEDCLSVVIVALLTCDLPATEVIAWCSTMIENYGVGFIADETIEALRTHWQRIAAK